MYIADLHCDTLSKLAENRKFAKNSLHITPEKLQTGEYIAQCFAVFSPDNNKEHFKKQYYIFKNIERLSKGIITPAKSAAEIKENMKSGKISAILTVENAGFTEGDKQNIQYLDKIGVRFLSLVWNNENSLARPHNMSGGLKDNGIDTVEILNNTNIFLDVSHLNDEGIAQVFDITNKPVVATHSCCRKIFGHTRNLTDSQIRKISLSGGIIGINYYAAFLADENIATVYNIISHIRHAVNIGGIECVCLGSDLDGIDAPIEFKDSAGVQFLANRLLQYFSAREVEYICYKNVLRLL